MYSGGDSSGEGVNSRNQFNWQMTSQTSCNVNSGGSIDWASLAQQWIQMKDSAGLPEAPPPPLISSNAKAARAAKFDEQGEADMEVEKDDEPQIVDFGRNTPPPPPPSSNINATRWIAPQPDVAAYCAPTPNQWTSWPARVALPPPILLPLMTGSLTPPIKDTINSTTPPLHIPKTPSEAASMLPSKESLEPPPMDAAKRKILPAWIREGLEKMEREKLKQLEREQRGKDPLATVGSPTADSDVNNKFKTMVKSSLKEMEGESSGNEADETLDAEDPDIDNESVAAADSSQLPISAPHENLSGKTYEERLSDMMIAVRKTLTELLLEVTNEEISSIAHETIRKRRAKASSAQVIRKSALPSITGKLGLEAYADSDTESSASDNDDTNDDSKRSDDENDSEEELKANIRISKRAFAKTVEEIEEKIQAAAMREEHILKEHQKQDIKIKDQGNVADYNNKSPVQKNKGFDKEIGEPQPDKKSNSNGNRRKERTSRFTDNKDSKNRLTASYYPPPSMGSGNLPSQGLPGAPTAMPSANVPPAKYKSANSSASSTVAPQPKATEKRSDTSSAKSKHKTSSSSSKRRRRSDSSSSSSSDSSSSSSSRSSHSHRSKQSTTRRKRSSTERSKRSQRSTSHRSGRRRDSSDSNDGDHYKKRSSRRHAHKSGSTSSYTRRHDRHRSDSRSSRSRTRSRSRSTTYSSSRRGDRY